MPTSVNAATQSKCHLFTEYVGNDSRRFLDHLPPPRCPQPPLIKCTAPTCCPECFSPSTPHPYTFQGTKLHCAMKAQHSTDTQISALILGLGSPFLKWVQPWLGEQDLDRPWAELGHSLRFSGHCWNSACFSASSVSGSSHVLPPSNSSWHPRYMQHALWEGSRPLL